MSMMAKAAAAVSGSLLSLNALAAPATQPTTDPAPKPDDSRLALVENAVRDLASIREAGAVATKIAASKSPDTLIRAEAHPTGREANTLLTQANTSPELGRIVDKARTELLKESQLPDEESKAAANGAFMKSIEKAIATSQKETDAAVLKAQAATANPELPAALKAAADLYSQVADVKFKTGTKHVVTKEELGK